MAAPVYLKVNNRDIKSTEVTYDDLVILYKQYIDKYGKLPTLRECDMSHNLPQYRIIGRLAKENGFTRKEFENQFTTPTTTKKEKIKLQRGKIKENFPIKIDNVEYRLFDDIIVENNGKGHNKYILKIIDDFGYKYLTTYNIFLCNYNKSVHPTKFFYNNPYTYDNINLYCILNNIDLHIDGTDLPITNYAREKLPFYDSNGNKIVTTWNRISHQKMKNKKSDELIKIKNTLYMSKEKATEIILNKAKNMNRPLIQSDFEGINTTQDTIGIRVIWSIWGNFNNMLDDLGLEKHDNYFKPNSVNYIPHDDIMNLIKQVCIAVKSTGRNIVMYKDFQNIANIDITKFRRHCKLENTTLNEIVKLYDCELQQCGNGMNYRFNDGERTVSRYEYDFSMFLRNNGFEYGKDYFRNIYYKKLDDKYTGNMNCDYKLIINGHEIYIELAGILGNPEHMKAYRSNTPIKSKSKEEYRQKLNKKREMFERNGLEYYILLPDEMNETTYKNILKKYLKEVA